MALPIESLNSHFEGTFRFKGKEYSVPFALPGDCVQFRIHYGGKKRRKGIEVLHIEKAEKYSSEYELCEPKCAHFANCGGCRSQHFSYSSQLKIKTASVLASWRSEFGVEIVTVPVPTEWGYRNRMDFVLNGQVLGLRAAGEFSKFVDIQRCDIQKESSNLLLQICRKILGDFTGLGFCRSYKHANRPVPPQDVIECGVLKYITIRNGFHSGAIVLTVAEDRTRSAAYIGFVQKLIEILKSGSYFPDSENYSIIETTTDEHSELSCTPDGRVLFGSDSFQERLCGVDFQIPYDSFFQTNPTAFEFLFEKALGEFLRLRPAMNGFSSRLFDLYSGAGVLSSIFTKELPDYFKEVFGVDFTESAVANAAKNFRDYDGCLNFFARDLNQLSSGDIPWQDETDVVIMDPPRTGLSPALKKNILEECRASHLLYISCNPDTQFRDAIDIKSKYRPVAGFIADCYPQTPHLEQAVIFERVPGEDF